MIDNPLNRLKVKRGEELPWAKLNETDVKNIRELISYREGLKEQARTLTNAKLAEKFGVHIRTIDRISTGESWSHI